MKSLLIVLSLFILFSCQEPELLNDCSEVQPYRESWCVVLSSFQDFDPSYGDTAYAFAGVEASYVGYNFNNHYLELWASDVQDTEFPAPTSYSFMTNAPTTYSNGPSPYIVLIENDFQKPWQNTYGLIDSSLSGKYIYVKMRLVNDCDSVGPWIIVAVKIDDVPGNTNCSYC